MRKLVLLVGLCMLGALTFGSVAVAQTAEWRADQIAAAVESGQMTQAEACADPAYVQVFPEACEPVQTAPVEPLTAAPTETATPGPVEPLTAAPAATATATATADATGGTAALPETGGLGTLSLAALGLLIAGGLVSARLIRR